MSAIVGDNEVNVRIIGATVKLTGHKTFLLVHTNERFCAAFAAIERKTSSFHSP